LPDWIIVISCRHSLSAPVPIVTDTGLLTPRNLQCLECKHSLSRSGQTRPATTYVIE
jgi:hypothetical protein